MTDPEREPLRLERDLYLRLLRLGAETQLQDFVEDALFLLVETSGARNGYLELRDAGGEPVGWTARGLEGAALEAAKVAVSRGIIARAMALGEAIVTESALGDPRFEELASVQQAQIGPVLCVPIAAEEPIGVIYLERGRDEPAFTDEDRERLTTVSAHLAPFAAQRVALRSHPENNPTAEARARLHADGIVGRSAVLADVLNEAALVAPLDVNVLLTGESGTGKSQLARVIHDSSPRAAQPMLDLNCAALPAELFENELFGAQPGGHSTAQVAVRGKVAEADGGTLFLDEIGDMPLGCQAKLLQLLHSRVYYPLGAARPSHADIRVIAASNVDLEEAVAAGRFREDLYYRLCVLPIRMPSLRERRDDIEEIASALCRDACKGHRLPALTISHNALQALIHAEWPGNVRQLSNALVAAAIRAAGESVGSIEQRHLFPDEPTSNEPATLQAATREFQRALLKRTLEDCGWNVTLTAERLDVARSHLYKLIRAFGLERSR